MDNITQYLTKFTNMFAIPATQFFLNALIGAVILYVVFNVSSLKLLRPILALGFFVAIIVYLKISTLLLFILLFTAGFLLSKRYFKIEDNFFALILGLFAVVQLFIIIALLNDPRASLFSLSVFSLIIIISKYRQNLTLFGSLASDTVSMVKRFNIFDWWLILISMVLGSLPQIHWDAAHANLYNAKWYIIHNSFAPLVESISSLFPQNAIAYYSMFYQIGGLQALHLSFFLPLLLTIVLVKQYILKAKIQSFLALAIYAGLLTPIVVFQAATGYYDLLITCLLVSAVYALTFITKRNVIQLCLSGAFLIGFAGGMKFFALALLPLPILILYFHRAKVRRLLLPTMILSLFLSTFSLGIWTYRTYAYTSSPVFPFFQDYFPTPAMWVGHNNLEQNFMIQTTMKTMDWIKGGFALYPVASYFRAPEFMEATKGYPGTIYILAMLTQLIVLLSLAKRAYSKVKFSAPALIFVVTFATYFLVGLLTRYYRYLMPFQFILLLSTVLLIGQLFTLTQRVKYALTVLFILIIGLNFINLVEYYRYYPINNRQLFRPDYYQNPLSSTGPIGYLNTNSSAEGRVLDASQYLLSRVHLTPITYQCNWYWINGSQLIVDQSYAELLSQFDYLVTSDPPETAVNYCQEFITKVISDPGSELVYSDHVTHRIYKIQHEKR